MALPWWLRGGLTGGAALLKEHLKKKGKELVGEARKKAIAKLAKKQKNGKKEKPKKKYTMPRKKLMEHSEREAKREETKKLKDSIIEEYNESYLSRYEIPPKDRLAAVERHKKADKAFARRKAMQEDDARMRRIRGGGHTRTDHSITGKVKGDKDLKDFNESLLKHDIRVAKHVRGLQKLKKQRDATNKYNLLDKGKPKSRKQLIKILKDSQKLTRKFEINPKLAKPAKESFQRIQKKKDRFKKKDAKKKGKQGD